MTEGGAETSWSNDTGTITLQDILELTKHIKQINLPINDNLKSKLLHWEGNPEEIERVNQVTVSNQFPILIMVDEQGQIAWILDGNHRLHKAIQSQAKTIPAKLIKPSNLNDKAKKIFNIKEQGVAEGSLNELAPGGNGGDGGDDRYIPPNFGKPYAAKYLGKNEFEVFCRPDNDPSKVIKLRAIVQKYGLEFDDDNYDEETGEGGRWYLDSPGAVWLGWQYGEIPLPKAIDQVRNPGHIHDLVTDYLTNAHNFEIQKIAIEYFGFTTDGEMNESVDYLDEK